MKQDRTSRAHYCRATAGCALPVLALVSGACYFSTLHAASAVTLENVLQTTLKKNPAIQEAKAGLERATGQRLVFRSVVWPHAEVGVPAGVQAGHRSGESGVKGFALGRGSLEQVLFNMAVPPSLRRGDTEVLIAQQQLKLAEAMAIDPAKSWLPEPDGELQFVPMHVDLDSETAAASQRRADLKLARLFVRAANEDERIIAADYYPAVGGTINGEYVPVTGIHRQGSTG